MERLPDQVRNAAADGLEVTSSDPANGPPTARRSRAIELARRGRSWLHDALVFAERRYQRALGRMAALTPSGAVGALCGAMGSFPLTAEHVWLAYAQGLFPVDKRGRVEWRCPDPRCVVPLGRLHVPSRVRTYLRKGLFELSLDRDPVGVLEACADRRHTWLTPRLRTAYLELSRLGALHTVEARKADRLVGGLFGVAVGTVFTVESMFSRESHASKLAFAFVAQQLSDQGFTLIDCQYPSDHFRRFGAVEIPRDDYRRQLAHGLLHPADFPKNPAPVPGAAPAQAHGSAPVTG